MPPVSSQQMPDMSMGMPTQLNSGIQSKPSMATGWPGQSPMVNPSSMSNTMSNVSAPSAINTSINTSASMGGTMPQAQTGMMSPAQSPMGMPGPDQQGGNALQNRKIIWKGKSGLTVYSLETISWPVSSRHA